MRITVEIDDRQRAELLKIAAQRGEKGFSPIVRDALDLDLGQQRGKWEAVARAIEAQGCLSDSEADAMEGSIRQLRERWR
jgi:hypothetical protein